MGKGLFLIFLTLMVFGNAHAQHAYVPSYIQPASTIEPGSYKIYLNLSQFNKTSSIDANGEAVPVSEGETLSMNDGLVSLGYGFGKSFYVEGFLRGRQISSTSEAGSLSNSGLRDYGLAAKIVFERVNDWAFALEARASQTPFSNDEFDPGQAPNDEIVLDDSGTTIMMGGHLAHNWTRNHIISGSAFYVIPPANLSQEVRWNLHYAMAYRRVSLEVGVDGIYSLQTDDFAAEPDEKPSINSVNAAQFNSINREQMEPYAKLSFSFRRFRLGLFGSMVYNGASTDEGNRIGLDITYFSEGVSEAERRVYKFKEYLVEASVIKLSPRGKFVKIDKGLSSDIERGMRFDIYKSDFLGGNLLIASGIVHEVSGSTSVVRITKIYKNIPIKKGFYARGF